MHIVHGFRMEDVHQLRVFAAVAESLSFTRAAEVLFMTQSGVSHQIARLEKSIGARLFVREARSVALTRAVGTHANDFRDVVTSFAMSFKASGAIRQSGFAVTPEMRAEFLRRLAERKVVIDPATARMAGPVLDRLLALQIERYVFGNDAEFRRSLRDDPVVQRAIDVLSSARDQKQAIQGVR